MPVAIGDLLAHSNHGTAWPFGVCQARDALILVSTAAQRLAASSIDNAFKIRGVSGRSRPGGCGSPEVLRGRPVVAEVGLWVILCPAVEDLRQRSGLSTSGRQILLQHECEDDVALGREVRDVLGDD